MRPGTKLQAIWDAIRSQAAPFSSALIQAQASASAPHVTRYLRRLTAAGYIRALGDRSRREYELLDDPGPVAPRIGPDGEMEDPNAAITGEELRDIQTLLGLSDRQLCLAVGWSANSGNNIQKMKRGKKPIRQEFAEAIWALVEEREQELSALRAARRT